MNNPFLHFHAELNITVMNVNFIFITSVTLTNFPIYGIYGYIPLNYSFALNILILCFVNKYMIHALYFPFIIRMKEYKYILYFL